MALFPMRFGRSARGPQRARRNRPATRHNRFQSLGLDALEPRLALTANYVDFDFSNQSDSLADTDVWLWVTGQESTATTAPTLAFQVDTTTGIATPITDAATTVVPVMTLAELGGRPIRFDADTQIVGGRFYMTTSPYSIAADATSSAALTAGNATVAVQGISTGQVGAGDLKPGMLVTGSGIPAGTTVTTVNTSAPPIQTTATFATGVGSFTVASTTGLFSGMLVTGPGLPNLATVHTVDLGTRTITLATGVLTQSAQTGATLSFSQSSVVLSAAPTSSTGTTAGAPNSVNLSFFLPAVTIGPVDGVVQMTGGSAASTADYVYDLAEFAITPKSGSSDWTLTVDTTQVDQFGLPFRLQTTPADAINPAGSGTIPTASRADIFTGFTAAMTAAGLTPFLDCAVPGLAPSSPPLRLLAPQDVISRQAAATKPLQTPVTSVGDLGGAQGAWTAKLTVPAGTAGQLLNDQEQLTGTFYAFGGLLPAGTLVIAADATANTITVQTASQATTNPFSTAAGQFVTIYTPPTTGLNTWFGPAVGSTTNVNGGNPIDDFFAHWKARPGQLRLEVTGSSGATVYSGTVTQIQQTSTTGTTATYAVLQMANTSTDESYNIFYPYFTTNSPATKTDPFGNPVPAPPAWMFSGSYLSGGSESPSQMVFAADGVFANSAQAPEGAPPAGAYTGIPTALGSLENQIVTALARGYARTWQTVENAEPGTVSPDGKTVTYQLPKGTLSGATPTNTLSVGMNVSSWKIFSVPMEITSIDVAKDQITVTTPETFTGNPPVNDMLLFFDMYPDGQQWSGYAKFLHNLMGYDVMIDGRAYALPYDDNGGFSTTLSSVYNPTVPLTGSGSTAARATVTLGNWTASRPAIDLNGDGIQDVVWLNETAGTYVGWVYDANGQPTEPVRVLIGTPWKLAAAGYFDDDNITDFVWRYTGSGANEGANVLWNMNADGTVKSNVGFGGTPTTSLQTSGDYNGDGITDLVWKMPSSDHLVWIMNAGGTVAATTAFATQSGAWQLARTGADYDADGDGNTDLVWFSGATHVVYLMDGAAAPTAAILPAGPAGSSLATTGDFNSDGISDLVWAAIGSSTVEQQLMGFTAGAPVVQSQNSVAGDSGTVVEDSAAFWGNNLVWRSATTGVDSVWTMLGSEPQKKKTYGGSLDWRLIRRPGQA
jgi:hypothetical protein